MVLAASLCAAPAAWAADPGVTSDTIRIGRFGPLTGPVSIYGYPINDGAIAVYKQMNDAGGINGRKIEIVQEDDACDPTKRARRSRSWSAVATCSWCTSAVAVPQCSPPATPSSTNRCRS
jgi:ABC-type branched-subunit amino acid transport system substrate-binding protein